jgi:hypothetical protein
MDGEISGATNTLGIDITHPTVLYFEADAEVGAVSVAGMGTIAIGEGEPPGDPYHLGSLNASDDNPISLLEEAGLFAMDGDIGALTAVEHNTIQLGLDQAPGNLAVEGNVTFNSGATLVTFINNEGTVAGSSELTAKGTVALAGAALHLRDAKCELLEPGAVDTLVATTGAITGTFKDVPNGTTIPLECEGEGRTPTAMINYRAHEVTATIETPGATPSEREEEAAAKKRAEEEAVATKKHQEEVAASKEVVQVLTPGNGGTDGGGTSTSTAATTGAEPAPVLGQRQTTSVISGTVSLRRKGTSKFTSLSRVSTIPDGSEVEATKGHVLITVATLTPGKTQTAEIWGGRFLIHQERTGSGETHLTLSLPLTGCPRVTLPRGTAATLAVSAKHSSGPKSRHLWVSEGGGSWGTNGRYVSTTVEGTRWLTQDECNQSEVQVAAGKVKVDDLVRNKTKTLTNGQHYTAKRR